jgi:hypothetical protein
LLFRRRPGHRRLFEKGLVEPRNVGIVNLGILYTVNRGWRDANRTAAGTAALQRRFPQRLKSLLILRQLRLKALPYPRLESWWGLEVKSPALSQKARLGRATP